MLSHSGRARNGRALPMLPTGLLNDYPVRLRLSRGVVTAGGISDLPTGRTFHKTIHAEHFLRSPRAIGLSLVVVDFLQRNRVEQLLVRHAAHGTEYRATLAVFTEHSFTQRRDADIQAFLALDRWSISHPVLQAAEIPASSLQLNLFEVQAS